MGKFNSRGKGVLKAKKQKARSAKTQRGAATQHKVQVSLQSGKRTGKAKRKETLKAAKRLRTGAVAGDVDAEMAETASVK